MGILWVMSSHCRSVKLVKIVGHGGGSLGGWAASEGSWLWGRREQALEFTFLGIFPTAEHGTWHGIPSFHFVKEVSRRVPGWKLGLHLERSGNWYSIVGTLSLFRLFLKGVDCQEMILGDPKKFCKITWSGSKWGKVGSEVDRHLITLCPAHVVQSLPHLLRDRDHIMHHEALLAWSFSGNSSFIWGLMLESV